jgi:hypothetical protein
MENEDKEGTKKINEEFNREQLEIIRDPIVAILIIKVKNSNESFHINTVPITIDWNNFNEDNSVCAEDEVIGVVSAPQHSYMVSGLFPRKGMKYPDGTFKSLGYEFEGAYRPDWKEVLERRIKHEDSIENSIEDSLADKDEI